MLQVQKPSEVALLRGVQDGGRGSTVSNSRLKLTGYQPCSNQHQALCSRCPYNILGCKGTTWRGEQIYMTLVTHTWCKRIQVDQRCEGQVPSEPPFFSLSRSDTRCCWRGMWPMVTMREVDYEWRMELIPCKVEERKPAIFWNESYRISRLLGPQSKSFLFRLINTLLTSRKREHDLIPSTSPLCWFGALEDGPSQNSLQNQPKLWKR